MKSGHEDIREILPEYIKGSLPEDLRLCVEGHLKGCRDCRDELTLISEIISEIAMVDIPDPGELFWKTLPQKVRVSVKEGRKDRFSLMHLFLRPLSLAAAVSILLLSVFIFRDTRIEVKPYFYYVSNDPLAVSLQDYSSLAEKDIPLITDESEADGLDLRMRSHEMYSYHIDIASLSSREMDSLYEALKNKQYNGG